jgi:hypothetical protein
LAHHFSLKLHLNILVENIQQNMNIIKYFIVVLLASTSFSIATAQNIPSYLPADGLVGWWPFSGNVNDESGNNLNGIIAVVASGIVPTLDADRYSNSNSAYKFTGQGEYIYLPAPPDGTITNAFSYSLWLKPEIYEDWLSAFNPTNSGKFLLLRSNATGVRAYDGNSFYIEGIDPTIGSSEWINFTVIYNEQLISVYYNSVLLVEGVTGNTVNYYNQGTSVGQYSGSIYSYRGLIDDIGIWNRALTQEEIESMYIGAACSKNTSITPQNAALTTGSSAILTASTSDPNPIYNWQTDLGQGFITLNNFGNYSGATSETLNISNVQLSNHNQPIRVISKSGICIDTSAITTITILDTCLNVINDTVFTTVTDTLIIDTQISGVNPQTTLNTIKIYPNPTKSHITIDYGDFAIMNGYQLRIENSLGQEVFQTSISQQSNFLSLSTWGGNGLYFVHILDPQGNTIDIRKIVLQ